MLILLPPLQLTVAPLDQSYNRVGYRQRGEASYYADQFHGRKTANGEKFDMNALTAAHPRIRFNTLLRVTNLRNNQSVIVRINDRGPYVGNRIIDLSKAAAGKIDMIRSGVAPVQLEVLYVETGPMSDQERRENEERIRRQEERGGGSTPRPNQETNTSEDNQRRSVLERIRRLLGKKDGSNESREESGNTNPAPNSPPPQPEPPPRPEEKQAPQRETRPQPEPQQRPGNQPLDTETFAGINTYQLDGTITYPEGYGVQVGSFSQLQAAIRKGREVEQTRFANVYIQTGWSGSVRVFRIIAGEGTIDQAQALAARLKTKGFNGFVRQHY